jgi:tRNA A-37 threonylcarbamoyl transferase component Bud32/predicted esterase
MSLAEGDRLGPYEVVAPLGAGGMGQVYRARDPRLQREVAVKVLHAERSREPELELRFEREARAASALNHPHICSIYDVGEHEGQRYLVMELLRGQTLRQRMQQGRLPLEDVLRIGREVADALAAAHAEGIVHRDVTPANVFLTEHGEAKVLDFGLAKIHRPGGGGAVSADAPTREATDLTGFGSAMGTLGYMSPEQVLGRQAATATDVFSLGVVLYEMAVGRRPFQGDTVGALTDEILHKEPFRQLQSGPTLPSAFVRLVDDCLRKDPTARCSAGDVRARIDGLLAPGRGTDAGVAAWHRWRASPAAWGVAIAALGVAGIGGWLLVERSHARWATDEALPEVTRLIDVGEMFEAYRLALEAERYIPEDPNLEDAFARMTLPYSVTTTPEGAQVHVKDYATPDAPWEYVGETPLTGFRLPYAMMRWRITKEGYEPFVGAPFGDGSLAVLASGLPLHPTGERPAGMVWVPAGQGAPPELPPATVEAFWIDQHEVTNAQFQAFVDAGGYQERRYWAGPFVDGSGELSWEKAQARFRDRAGRPGPATWELGRYPEGREAYPVGGVSWYEAQAYCAFVQKSLPTIYHWTNAIGQAQLSDILELSNFGADGPAPVGTYQGLAGYGTYDQAGNVKEWCWNETGTRRFILGGAWGEPVYMFMDPEARTPLDRAPTNGFRCARYDDVSGPARAPVTRKRFEAADLEPVSDEVFEAYLRMYAYDRRPLNAKVENEDDTPSYWRRAYVSFDASYGDERMGAVLFLPRNAAPPYQTVVVFPGADAFMFRSRDRLSSPFLYDFIPRSGRALVYPIYKGMYERSAPRSEDVNARRDAMISYAKDLGRTIDYLETREDIDAERLAYYGFSLGAVIGPVLNVVEIRFKASVLLGGGLASWAMAPEASTVNFAPRSKVPTLLVDGRDDFFFPVDALQRPFFDLIGVPEADKRHALLDGGHIPSDRLGMIKEILDWLDRYLGPVRPPEGESASPASADAAR